MQIQRKFHDNEKILTPFLSNRFKFVNFNFIDLDKSISKEEKEDFWMYEKYNVTNEEMLREGYKVGMEVILKQKPGKELERRKKYRFVVAISRAYQFLAYAILIWIFVKIFDISLNRF